MAQCAILAVLVSRSAAEEEASNIVKLTKFNFNSNVKTGFWFVKFYAPWCTHCQRLKPIWAKLADQVASREDGQLKIAEVDCTTAKEVCEKVQVKAFPLLMLIKDGEMVDKYQGEASVTHFEEWLTKKVNEGGSSSTGSSSGSTGGVSGASDGKSQTSIKMFYSEMISKLLAKMLAEFPTKSQILNLYFYGFMVVVVMVLCITRLFKYVEEEDLREAEAQKSD